MEKPSITIDLKKHLHDFLLHEFKTDTQGAIILNRHHDVAIYINSMWTVSTYPKMQRKMDNPVTLLLPITEDNHYIVNNSFIFVPVWKEKMINDYLESEFRRRIRDFFSIGYEKKFQQKDIIEAFLKEYGMKNNAINFDQIKKIDYRNRERFKMSIVNEIQKAMI
jgi:hypothetical protein